ncbi:MAG: hypothetical protein ASARMPRED_003053 [Alectoria sarmentosa]|nr:MAG: hypothetical protein ASARMPRED_003053 [Alectoria sarmentosa]
MDPKPEEAIHHERQIRIICVGAGASGLCLAYKLQRSFRRFKLTIYEKNEEVSGTWYENTYPGCACDIPAHNYVYTFEPKPDWPNIYASSWQIRQYFHDFCCKYDLMKYIKLRQKVFEARWAETERVWKLRVQDLTSGQSFDDTCDIFIYACGYLNHWVWPKITGLDEYQGDLVHSANWDILREQKLSISLRAVSEFGILPSRRHADSAIIQDSRVELRDKKIGLIGNGSSAVQILTQIQPEVARLTHFIRSPLWIFPPIEGDQRPYTPQEIETFTSDPRYLLSLRKRNEATANSMFSLYLRNSVLQNQVKTLVTSKMKEDSGYAFPEDKLIPRYSVGCRRITPGPGYLKALTQENINVVYQGVAALTRQGCKLDNGQEESLDVIICATGFDTSFRPRFPILGFDDKNLQDTENIDSFCPKTVAVDDFADHVQSFMQHTVWTEGCRSGFKNNTVSDRIPTLWPGSTLHCLEALRELRADDWDIRYHGNRFAWLGNGISQTEFDPTSDLGYSIRDHDDSPFSSRGLRREILSRSGTQPARELHRRHQPDVVNL